VCVFCFDFFLPNVTHSKDHDPHYHNVFIFVCLKYFNTRPFLSAFADLVEETGIKEQDVTSVGKSNPTLYVSAFEPDIMQYKLLQNINVNI